jgi:uncharacterized protein
MGRWRRWSQAYVGLLWQADGWLTRLWHRGRVQIRGRCEACGECCRQIVLSSDGQPLRDAAGFERLLARDEATYGRFVPQGRNGAGDLLFRCTKLGEDGRCTVHAERPPLCRRYPEPRMFLDGGALPQACTYEVVFPAARLR